MPADAILGFIDQVTAQQVMFEQRRDRLVHAVAGNARLAQSLNTFLDPQRAPGGASDYIAWVSNRLAAYRALSVDDIQVDAILDDLRVMATNYQTKIPNMGIALAANFLADLGVRSVAKPDLHVLPTINGLLKQQLSRSACIEQVINLAQHEAPEVHASPRFAWLNGDLFPRDLDRTIYLIGSDNFCLNGRRKKRQAPARRQLMLHALQEA